MTEKYIITWEDGTHYISDEITDLEKEAVTDGTITVIRYSDLKQLNRSGEWLELRKWKSN